MSILGEAMEAHEPTRKANSPKRGWSSSSTRWWCFEEEYHCHHSFTQGDDGELSRNRGLVHLRSDEQQ